jgi:uncharacterized cupin superfamily protein
MVAESQGPLQGESPRETEAVNLNRLEFDEVREHPGFTAGRARIGRRLGSRRLGASLWELPPGEAAYPYHFHLAEEELLVILSAEPTLRTPEGLRDLEEGEAIVFWSAKGALTRSSTAPIRRFAFSPSQTNNPTS